MKRAFGIAGLPLIECVNPQMKKYRIRWDITPEQDEENDDTVSFMEAEVLHKPSLKEVKDIVLNGYNQIVDEKILSGFVWKDMLVWLSSENQFNYKAAYDLAIQTGGVNLPIMFKFGDTENPVYHTFTSVEELSDFYLKAMAYINEQLSFGWQEKDAIDWSGYEALL